MTDFSSHNLISAYVDDRLSPEERAEVEALLQSSQEARAELDSFRQLRKTLKALPTEPAPPDLVTRVMAQAEQESLHGKPLPVTVAAADGKGSFRKRWTIPALSVVATVGLVLLVAIEFRPPQDTAENVAATNDVSSRSETASAESFDDDIARVADRTGSMGNEGRERNLTLTDQFQFEQDGNRDGTINLFRAYDLRTAEVGDVIDALQVQDDGVTVVQLTVIDRQRFLDAFHVMLSGIPSEARGENNYGERKNDMIAVYVEAGEGRLKALMAQLQMNSDVEQMFVSRTIPSADLNPYVAEQGYRDVWAIRNSNDTGQNSIPQETEGLKKSVTSNESREGDRDQSARPADGAKDKETDVDRPAEKKSPTVRRSITDLEYPPPPPLATTRERQQADSKKEVTAPAAEPADGKQLAKNSETDAEGRQITLRIPQSDARRLIGAQQPAAQLSMLNGEAADRQIEGADLNNFRRQTPSRRKSPPTSRFADTAPAEKPAAPRPEPSAPQPETEGKSEANKLRASLSAPKPDAATAEDSVRRAPRQKGEFRPLQVLFVLTDEALPAANPVPSSSTEEAKQAPQK